MSYIGYFDNVLNDAGHPIVATISVFNAGTAVLATIYSTPSGVIKDNPFITDVLGRFQFFASPGAYDIEVSGTGITIYKIESVQLFGAHELLSATHPDVTAGAPVLGDIIVADDTPEWKRKAGQITATRKFLRQTGTGVVSAEPDWDILVAGDLPTPAIGCLVSAYLNSAQNNLTDDTWTIVTLDAETFDVGSHFNTGAYKFTAPVAGYYLIGASVTFKGSAGYVSLLVGAGIYKNNTTIIKEGFSMPRPSGGASDRISIPISGIIYLSANDYIVLRAYVKGSTGEIDLSNLAKKTFLDIALLSI